MTTLMGGPVSHPPAANSFVMPTVPHHVSNILFPRVPDSRRKSSTRSIHRRGQGTGRGTRSFGFLEARNSSEPGMSSGGTYSTSSLHSAHA